MPHSLQADETAVTPNITSAFESFWLYLGFKVTAGSNHVQLKEAFFATLFSQDSSSVVLSGRVPPASQGIRLTVTDAANNSFQLAGARLIARRVIETNIAIDHLQLFQLDPLLAAGRWSDLFQAPSWRPNFQDPTTSASSRTYWPHHLDLNPPSGANSARIQDRLVYSLSSQEGDFGTDAVTAVVPFLQFPVFEHVLNLHNRPMSDLKIQTQRAWTEFGSHRPVSAGRGIGGFVMVAQGAFENLPLDSNFPTWVSTGAAPPEALLLRLADTVSPSHRTALTLGGAKLTNTAQESKDGAGLGVEVLYLEGLTSGNRSVPEIPYQGARSLGKIG